MTEKHGVETKEHEEEKDTTPKDAKKTMVFECEHATALVADLVSLSARPASPNRRGSSPGDGSSGTRTTPVAAGRAMPCDESEDHEGKTRQHHRQGQTCQSPSIQRAEGEDLWWLDRCLLAMGMGLGRCSLVLGVGLDHCFPAPGVNPERCRHPFES